jgi:PPE-repeat protein
VIGSALAVLLGASGSAPAYAVSRNSDGTVSVRLQSLAGIAGANHALRSMGIRAAFVHARAMANWVAGTQPCKGMPAGGVRTITFNPAGIPHSQTEVLGVDRTAQVRFYTAVPTGSLSNVAARVHALALEAAKTGTQHPFGEYPNVQRVRPGDGTGNSGSGNSGTGNSGTGNSGTGNSGAGNSGTGNSGTVSAGPGTAGTGNSGTGNSGTGNSGTGTTVQLKPGVHTVVIYCGRSGVPPAGVPAGNSGTGNSGNTGTGNSGTGNSGNTGTGDSGAGTTSTP